MKSGFLGEKDYLSIDQAVLFILLFIRSLILFTYIYLLIYLFSLDIRGGIDIIHHLKPSLSTHNKTCLFFFCLSIGHVHDVG